MKFRSKEEIIERVHRQSKERKRELITLDQLLETKRDHEKHPICRTSVLLSYAHWEGFVKESSIAYLDYIAFLSKPLISLTVNIQATACKPYIQKAALAPKKIFPHIDVINTLLDSQSNSTLINARSIIDTESNLSAGVFENICNTVGIDYKTRWSKLGPFINDFVEVRCSIAHGELFRPEVKYAKETIQFTIDAIDQYKTDIENAVVTKAFLKNA